MKKRPRLFSIGLLLSVAFLLACTCSGPGFPFTLFATATPTPTPTATPTPTPPPTPTSSVELDNPVTVQNGGFSFRPVRGYQVEIENDAAYINSPNLRTLAFMAGTYDASESEDLQQLSQDFLDEIRSDMPDLVVSAPWTLSVGGVEGQATDLSGTLSGTETVGRLVVAVPYSHQFFVAVCLTNGADEWEREGRQAFEAMLGSVTFFPLR